MGVDGAESLISCNHSRAQSFELCNRFLAFFGLERFNRIAHHRNAAAAFDRASLLFWQPLKSLVEAIRDFDAFESAGQVVVCRRLENRRQLGGGSSAPEMVQGP